MATLGSATALYQYGHIAVASGVGLLTSGHVSANEDSRFALTGVSGDPSGYLHPDDVVLYHPCDDRNEWTTGQTWQGPVGSAAAKVSSGFAPVVGDRFSVGPESEFKGTAISLFQGGAPIVHLTPSSAVVAYVAGGVLYAKVGTTSGSTQTWGEESAYASSGNVHDIAMTALSPSSVAVAYTQGNWNGRARIGTVSGATITWGDEASLPTTVTQPVVIDIQKMGASGLAVLLRSTYGGWPVAERNRGRVVAGQVSGTTIAFPDSEVIYTDYGHDAGAPAIVAMDDSRAVLFYRQLGASGARLIEVVGTGITLGPAHSHDTHAGTWTTRMARLDGTRFVACSTDANGGADDPYVRIGEVSVATSGIGFGPAIQFGNRSTYYDVEAVAASSFLAVYGERYAQPGPGRAVKGFVADDLSITLGEETIWASGNAIDCYVRLSLAPGSDDAIVTYGDEFDGEHGKAKRLAPLLAIDLAAPISTGYPTAVGASGITFAFWYHNMQASGNSEIIIERTYSMRFGGPSGITQFGNLVWDVGPGSDSGSHFLVADFRYQGGNVWTLKTSFDGGAWVDQGPGSGVGFAPISGPETTPQVAASDMESDQWIDEVIMWADAPEFTGIDLSILHKLGSELGKGMNLFDTVMAAEAPLYTFGVLGKSAGGGDLRTHGHIATSGEIDLHTFGILGWESVQAPLAVEGAPGPGVGPATSGWAIAELFRTHDHDPQVIGLLDYVGTSGDVTITVYELVNMAEVSIAHSGCYPIGDTGRWGWSTAYLPGDTRPGQHFLYRMVAGPGVDTFTGEFFLKRPQSERR